MIPYNPHGQPTARSCPPSVRLAAVDRPSTMGVSMPPEARRSVFESATTCEPAKDAAQRYDVVAIDANAMLR